MQLKTKLFVACSLISLGSQAQQNNPESEEKAIESVMESASDDIDFSDLVNNEYQKHSFDINQATLLELMQLKTLNILQLQAIIDHRNLYGRFNSIYELQTIKGFDSALIQTILPYIQISSKRWKDDIRSSNLSAKISLATSFRLEQSSGYVREDSLRFSGSPFKYNLRADVKKSEALTFGFHAEKDAGESMQYVFKSAYLQFRTKGILKSLIIGDHQLQFAQGLWLGTGLNMGKSSMVMQIIRNGNGGKVYRSFNELGYLRGVCTEIALSKNIHVIGFCSKRILDSKLSTDSNGNTEYGSVSYTGLYRNTSELLKRHTLLEGLYGARIIYNARNIQLGAGVLNHLRNDGKYSKYGVDFRFQNRNYLFFGELAARLKQFPSIISGLLISLGKRTDMSFLFRNYRSDFDANLSNALAEGSQSSNEKGLYNGLSMQLPYKLTISTYSLITRNRMPGFQRHFSSYSSEEFIEIAYRNKDKLNAYLRFRFLEKNINQVSDAALYPLAAQSKNIWRLHLEYMSGPFRLRNRIEQCVFRNGNSNAKYGILMYQDIQSKIGSRLKLTMRYSLFDAEDFNSRAFSYENDVPGTYTISSYSGKGSRYYLLFQIHMKKDLQIWFRFARSSYYDRDFTGSGIDKISSSHRTDISCLLQWNIQ